MYQVIFKDKATKVRVLRGKTFLHGLIKMSGKVLIHSAVFLMNLIDLHLTFDNYYFLKRAGVQITITCAHEDVS